MKDMREVVLYFGDGCKLVPIDIAKSLSDRFEELGNPLVLTPEASQKTAPLVVFKDNPDFMATVTQMTINLVVNHTYFDKLETIIFDVVDAFDDLNISLIKMGLVYSIFLSPDKVEVAKNRLLNMENLPDDLIDLRLAWYKKIPSKHGDINCWERVITDTDQFKDLLFQFDFNTMPDENANFDMKFIKEIVSIANDYSEERTDI
jgi:hypothetical protein